MKIEWTSIARRPGRSSTSQFAHWDNYFPLYPTQTQSTSTEGVPVGRIDLDTNQLGGARLLSLPGPDATSRSCRPPSRTSSTAGGRAATTSRLASRPSATGTSSSRFQPGDIYYRDRGGVPSEVDIYNTPNKGINDATTTGIYVQDGWNVTRRFTINAGLRFDRYKIGLARTELHARTRPRTSRRCRPRPRRWRTSTRVSPRLGFAWDLTGSGKTVWKAFFGRFYYNPSTDVGSTARIPWRPGSATSSACTSSGDGCDLNGNRLLDGPQELGRLLHDASAAPGS